jgi:hypothetical protein
MTGDRQRTGGVFRGTHVIPIGLVEIDGVRGASADTIFVGSHLRWSGAALRIDGPDDLLTLDAAEGAEALHRGAARSVRRLLGDLAGPRRMLPADVGAGANGHDYTVTDGCAIYHLMLAGEGRLLAVSGPVLPRDTDLVVIGKGEGLDDGARPIAAAEGVICFVAGTRLATPEGLRPVEAFRPGDRILTRDSGAQEVLWTGRQHLSGARLFAMPGLRPIRIRSGALGKDRPEGDLLVSPRHGLLLKGRAARRLYNEAEVLVSARDLVDGGMIRRETALRDVTYVHLLTAQHEIVWANGVEAETFHPANANLDLIAPEERAALARVAPQVDSDPFAYSGFARRALSAPEAAILRFATSEAPASAAGGRALTLSSHPV